MLRLGILSRGQAGRSLHQLQEDLLDHILDLGTASEQKGRVAQARRLMPVDEGLEGPRFAALEGDEQLVV